MTADDLKVWAKKGVQSELDEIEYAFGNVPSDITGALARAQRYSELLKVLADVDATIIMAVDKTLH